MMLLAGTLWSSDITVVSGKISRWAAGLETERPRRHLHGDGHPDCGSLLSESVGLRRRGDLSCVAWGHEESEERTPREDFLEEREPRHPRGQGQLSQGHWGRRGLNSRTAFRHSKKMTPGNTFFKSMVVSVVLGKINWLFKNNHKVQNKPDKLFQVQKGLLLFGAMEFSFFFPKVPVYGFTSYIELTVGSWRILKYTESAANI